MDLKNLIDLYGLVKYEKLKKRSEEFVKRYRSRVKSVLHNIAEEFVEFVKNLPNWRFEVIEDVFNFGKRICNDCKLKVEDIEELFNNVMPNYVRGGLLGSFISGLYSDVMGEDDILRLDLNKYSGSISGLGYMHKKGKLIVYGNRAFCLGYKMRGGIIEVFGNVGNYLGKQMEGGEIIVHGNARNWVGEKMKGGRIVIKGNAGDIIGYKMEGGEIVIKGKVGSWVGEDLRGGRILFE